MYRRFVIISVLALLLMGVAAGTVFALTRGSPPPEPAEGALAPAPAAGVMSPVPSLVNFQGSLTDSQSTPLTGTHNVTFSIYTMETGGAAIWQETQSVNVQNGLFSVLLGSTTPLTADMFAGPMRWLGIKVGGDPEMAPRLRVASVPYAFKADMAAMAMQVVNLECAGCVDSGDLANNAVTSSKIANDAVSNSKLAANSVDSSKIADGSITAADVAFQVGGGPPLNPRQVALLRWYEANNTGKTFAAGPNPRYIAFDGANIWVTNGGTNRVTKLRASDGQVLGTFAVGNGPQGIAFDGANIWVTNTNSNNVTKLRATDGQVLGTFAVGNGPQGIAFDGANIWVVNGSSNTVSKK